MCGAQHSILGKGLEPCIHNFIDPEHRMRITDAEGPCMINGLVAEIDTKTQKCQKIELIDLRNVE